MLCMRIDIFRLSLSHKIFRGITTQVQCVTISDFSHKINSHFHDACER